MTLRYCALIPTLDNPQTVGPVVAAIREWLPDVIVVDDGSGPEGAAACRALEETGQATVVTHARNLGKGAAVKTGLAAAQAAGFTHAFQIDADGQHAFSEVPHFLAVSRAAPEKAVLGYPVYDDSVSSLRESARKITKFWVDLEVGRDRIRDALIGFRIYPVDTTLALAPKGNRMEFDVEIAVLLCWAGVAIENCPVGVRYLSEAEGGLSHFQPFRDNLRLSWMHSRLCTRGATHWCLRHLGLIRGTPLSGSSA